MRNAQPPELGQEARAIIAAARDVHQPNELSRARVRKGVELKVAAGLGLAIAPAASALAGVLKVTLVAVAVGSTVAGGFYVLPQVRARHPQAPDAHRAIARAEIAQAAPGQPAMPEAAAELRPIAEKPPAVEHVHRHARVAPALQTHGDASDLAGETALLSAANAALARRDVAHATALLAAYDRQRAPGLLGEEREATGILVACAAGRAGAAHTEAARFRARWPRSPLLARIEGSCAGRTRAASEP